MIYIPIELQLKWIREDLQIIKDIIIGKTPLKLTTCRDEEEVAICYDCEFIKFLGLGGTHCDLHAPEFLMRINFPL